MDFITHLPISFSKMTIIVVVDQLSKLSNLAPQFVVFEVANVFTRNIVCLHSILMNIVFNRDPLFMIPFGRSYFDIKIMFLR